MRTDFDHVSKRLTEYNIKNVEVASLFSDYGQGFVAGKCSTVEAMVKAADIALNLDHPAEDLTMKILLEGKALHFEMRDSHHAQRPFLEFEFFISEMPKEVLNDLAVASSISGHSDKRASLVTAMANAVVDSLIKQELFAIGQEEFAVDAFSDIIDAWYEAEIQDRPVERQTWNLPRSQFTEADMKPQP